jgi:hypothetical protein
MQIRALEKMNQLRIASTRSVLLNMAWVLDNELLAMTALPLTSYGFGVYRYLYLELRLVRGGKISSHARKWKLKNSVV